MFGNDHKNQDKQDDVQPMSTQPVNNGLLGIDDDSDSGASSPTSSATPAPDPTPGGFSADTYGDAPSTSPASTPLSTPDAASDAQHTVERVSPDHSTSPSTNPSADNDDLLDIKKEALQELSPLIDHLEQNSEEKFRTTMMMIQASDNKTLIPQAFKAAREISDDKKRAQALLDIVNEINYFTHKNES